MNSPALLILAEVSPTPKDLFSHGIDSIQVLDYLKYGTLGLAGIILLLAFVLYRQANALPAELQMRQAQDGVSTYMEVAKWLLIPCMALQVLGIVLPYIFPPKISKPVTAWLRLPPLKKSDDVRYGAAGFKILHKGNLGTPQNLYDEERSIEICDDDIIVVNIADIVDRLEKLSGSEKPRSASLEPTAPHQ